MSGITINGHNVIIGVEGFQEVERELGKLKTKTPAVTKFAVNKTARFARKTMIMKAKARYAVNAAGSRKLDRLAQKKKATNTSLSAELFVSSLRSDLGYFETSPNQPLAGMAAFRAPEYFMGHVLKDNPMKPLKGAGNLSKGFLAKFKSGHVGMVQRIIGSDTGKSTTLRGYKRWKTADGRVEKLITMGSPSEAAMHNTVWPLVTQDVETFLQDALIMRAQQVLALAVAKGKRR